MPLLLAVLEYPFQLRDLFPCYVDAVLADPNGPLGPDALLDEVVPVSPHLP